ncbi:MAG: hypothetical protein H7Y15_18070 [Pseudonocardia sp.]|nr:hypothetical protein [Pseudonocardia sp.]
MDLVRSLTRDAPLVGDERERLAAGRPENPLTERMAAPVSLPTRLDALDQRRSGPTYVLSVPSASAPPNPSAEPGTDGRPPP